VIWLSAAANSGRVHAGNLAILLASAGDLAKALITSIVGFVFAVSDTGWIAIGATATALMAFMAFLLALASLSAARAAAHAVKEIQKDRELTFRPYVSWELGGGVREALTGMAAAASRGKLVNGVNLGNGPALNTVFCVVEDDQHSWSSTAPRLVDFSPGQKIKDEHEIGLVPGTGLAPPRPQVGPRVRKVAFCEDQLGSRYRFIQGWVIADVWRPGQAKTDWVKWYEANAPIASRT
jgi:hypothetical protein